MANKKITELQLIDEVTAGVNIPGDDGIQTYRFTAAQLKAYVLANGNITTAMLNDSVIHGLTAVTPASDDYVPLADTSDSNKIKKGLISEIKKATYRSITSTDSLTGADDIAALSGASFTLTLPTAVGIAGRKFEIIHLGTSLTQVYTLATTSGQTIGGVASGSYALYTNEEKLVIVSDGANWQILEHKTSTPIISAGALTIGSTGTPPTKATTRDYDEVFWYREGQFAHINYRYSQTTTTGGAAGTGIYLVSLPANMTLDTAVAPVSGTTSMTNAHTAKALAAHGSWITTAGGFFTTGTYTVPFSSTQLFFGTLGTVAAYQWGAGSGMTLSESFGLSTYVRVPISGWRP